MYIPTPDWQQANGSLWYKYLIAELPKSLTVVKVYIILRNAYITDLTYIPKG